MNYIIDLNIYWYNQSYYEIKLIEHSDREVMQLAYIKIREEN